ncbi:hypothetical protein HanPSC8_Chr06g0256211 [Helianthus annuus]|nr:hypothetical protein HanPSC8_Chr06g0256211 [Helianthus annuus]
MDSKNFPLFAGMHFQCKLQEKSQITNLATSCVFGRPLTDPKSSNASANPQLTRGKTHHITHMKDSSHASADSSHASADPQITSHT